MQNIMATMTATRKGRIDSINEIIAQIPTRNLSELERRIRMYFLMLEARRLDASVKPNNLTMEDIVAEVKKMRRGD